MLDRVDEDGPALAVHLDVGDQVRRDHGFAARPGGNPGAMIGVGVALIIIGIIIFFAVPWVGIAAGAIGLVLAILYFAGFGRRAARGQQPQP
jgi:1,4-dihydroxy-2-naphthoate octaprenyltransferase